MNAPEPAPARQPEPLDPSDPTLTERPDPDRPATAAPTEQQLECESPAGHDAASHDPYAALRYPNYWLYSLGWVFSVIGQQVQSVAVGWEVTHRHPGDPRHAALALGIVGGVQAVPVMLLSIPAGHLADAFDRRRIIVASTTLGAVFSAGLAAVSFLHWPIGWMYVLLGLNATALAIGWPARSALLPQIVPTNVFSNAATWNSSAFQVAALAGPALGGLVVNFTLWWAYALDAAFGLMFIVFLLLLTLHAAPRDREPATLSSLAAGVRFVWRTKIVLATITLDLFAVLLGGATALLPVYATDVLHVGAVGFGWLKAAPAIGAFVTALLIAHLPPMKHAGRAMLLAVAGFGAATIVFGVSKWYWLSLLAFALTGAFDNISVVVRHTLVQVLPPDSMRGRVSAVNNVFIGASNQLGELESGLAGWLLNPVWSVVAGGLGTLLVVAAVTVLFPQVRRFGSLRDARPVGEEGDDAADGVPVVITDTGQAIPSGKGVAP